MFNSILKRIVLSFALITTYSACQSSDINKLNPVDKKIDDISIGTTSIRDVKMKYGGKIFRKEDSEGSYNSLCLNVRVGNDRYLLHFVAAALGGWDIITEYYLEKASGKSEDCGIYESVNTISRFINKQKEYIYAEYGVPSSEGNNIIKYTFSYQETLNNKVITDNIWYVFSGIEFLMDERSQIMGLKVFEVKSN